MIAPNHL